MRKARLTTWLCQRYRSAHLTSRFSQGSYSASAADASLGHHQGHGDAASRGGEELTRGCVVESGGFFQNAHCPLRQLLILRVEVDHQVAVDVTETGHRSG